MFNSKNCITLEKFLYLSEQKEKNIVNSCLAKNYGHPFKYDDDSYFIAKNGGIQNHGNTCYIGSTIQCLNAITPFLKYLIESFAENELLYKEGGRHNLYKCYVEWLYKGLNRSKKLLTKTEFDRLRNQFFIELDAESIYLKDFKSCGKQQDADEFLMMFLSYLDNSINEINFIRNAVVDKKMQLSESFESYILSNNLDHKVSRIFFGIKTQLKFKCLESEKHPIEIRLEDGMDTKLNIEIDGMTSLYDCLNSYCNSNVTKHCKHCNKSVVFSLERKFHQLSDFLIICLKRFKVISEIKITITLKLICIKV